eukprot:TRINITY_DN4185_c0_g3_i1.p1 TRINITY_DN4185_c0_g3~~TRINITY_DN4185_c0_g3_i1.p1  ORF type:complete len:848 (-),score=172.28 TRINITY_DN4185_c0_g3_i1:527-3070(-)
MGCACSRPLRRGGKEAGESPVEKEGSSVSRSSSHASRRLVAPAAKDIDSEQEVSQRKGAKHRAREGNGAPGSLLADDGEKQRQQHYRYEYQHQDHRQHYEHARRGGQHYRPQLQQAEFVVSSGHPNPRYLPKHTEGEQVAAGWPVWLTAVAGEAIKGWIPRRADSFERLNKIGQGTYSNVYKARDLETGKIVALKKVRFDNLEPDSVRFMAREIQVLRRLNHPNVIKLEGLVTSRMSCSLYLVFEYMEHDLAGLAACPNIKFTEAQVKCYMQQLLRGLDHCHSRGVLHRDIKGSNLLIDNGGILKIADFGLATFYHPDQKQPLTSRVVTLWYRPPELLLGATEYGAAVDLWSTGCILAELLAGKPIMPGRTEVEQLHKIFKLCGSPSDDYWKRSRLPHATIFKPQQPYKRCVSDTFKDFPLSALALMEVLLAIEPANRGTAASALNSEFFATKPLPCDPSSLPKYPPCKEFDAKIRDEEARRRHRAGGGRGHHDGSKRVSQESRAIPAPEANAELAVSIQRRRLMAQGSSMSKSEKFNARQEDDAVGFPIDPPRAMRLSAQTSGNHHMPCQQIGLPHSGILPNSKTSSMYTKRHRDDDMAFIPGHSSSVTMDSNKQGMYEPQAKDDAANMPCVSVTRSNAGIDLHSEQKNGERTYIDGVQSNSGHKFHEVGHSNKQDFVSFQHAESFKGFDGYPLQDQAMTHLHRDQKLVCKESSMNWTGHDNQGDRIHYSGPLLPPTGNIDAMLKEHERHIQNAVRRARQDKGRLQKSSLFQSKRKGMEHKNIVTLANGNILYSDSNSEGPSSISSSGLKANRIRMTEEPSVQKDSEREPLSSVTESHEREDDLGV